MREPTDLVATLREALAVHDANGEGWSPLEWWVHEDGIYAADGDGIAWASSDGMVRYHAATAALIVAAVNALPGLLKEVEAGRALDAHLHQHITCCDGDCEMYDELFLGLLVAREANGCRFGELIAEAPE